MTVVSQGREVSPSLGVATIEPQPGLLEGVIGLGDRSEHPVGDGAQVGPMALELLGQPGARAGCRGR